MSQWNSASSNSLAQAGANPPASGVPPTPTEVQRLQAEIDRFNAKADKAEADGDKASELAYRAQVVSKEALLLQAKNEEAKQAPAGK